MILNSKQRLMAEKIIEAVCSEWGITSEELRSRTRRPIVIISRQTAYFLFEINNIPRKAAASILNFSKPSAVGQATRAKSVSSVDKDYDARIQKLQRIINKIP